MNNKHHGDLTVAGSSLVPQLEIIRGETVGRTYTLKFKTRLGRETDNDIVITDPKISRYHCQITFEDGQWVLTDLGSANGTSLNGMPLAVPQPLAHGSQIALGETILAFKDPLDQSESPVDPSTTIIGGAIPPTARPGAAPTQPVPPLAWIAGGLVLLLLLSIAGVILWQRRSPAPPPIEARPTAPVSTPVRTTPLPEANLSMKFEDDFSNSDSGWDDAFGKTFTKQYGNNRYHIEITTNNLVVWGLANRKAADFEAEVEVAQESAEPGISYGLIFRYIDHDNYYRFDISNDGFFLLTKFQNGDWNTLVDWTHSPAINPGHNNVLKVIANGPEIAIFANGQELARATDDTFQDGNFGFFASTFDSDHAWISFDNLKLWAPETYQLAVIPTPTPTQSAAVAGQAPAEAEATPTPAEIVAAVPTATPIPLELEVTAEPSATPPPTATAAPLPDFVTRDQPLARGVKALSGKIIFPMFDPAAGTYNIYRANTDGSDFEQIVAEASQPAANKTGATIAYRSWRADARGLYSRPITGGDTWRFATYFEAASPAFSPDDQFFVFHSREGGQTPALYQTVGTEHNVLRRDGAPVQGEMVAFTPDGKIVYRGCLGGNCGLVISNLDGSFPLLLTTVADDTAPAVSPNGKTVAFMTNRDGNWEIYTIDVDGQNLTRLTTTPHNNGLPAWAPDGKHIAFVSNHDGLWSVWAITPAGQDNHQLFALDNPIDGVVQLDVAYSFGWLEERIIWTP